MIIPVKINIWKIWLLYGYYISILFFCERLHFIIGSFVDYNVNALNLTVTKF